MYYIKLATFGRKGKEVDGRNEVIELNKGKNEYQYQSIRNLGILINSITLLKVKITNMISQKYREIRGLTQYFLCYPIYQNSYILTKTTTKNSLLLR